MERSMPKKGDGAKEAVFGLSVDIAEGRKAEEWPRFVAQLQTILNVLPAYAWYAAPSGSLTFVNKRTADYLGVPKDHPLRFGIDIGAQLDDWVPLLHPDDREESRKYWSNCLRTGEGGEHSYRVRSAQGDYRWFLTRFEPLRASDGTLLLWIGATLDIEELKCAEQSLRESETKIRRLVDANIIGIVIWDFDGRILEANEAFLDIVGYDHEDLVAGRIRWTDLTPPEWRDRDTRLIQEHRWAGTLQPFEKEYFRKDGSRVPVLIGVATFEESGNQGVAFVLDLTERKRVEERLRVQHMVAQILAEAATIEEATPRILRAMGECLGWDVGALWRVDREAEALRCVELWHKASIEVPEFERVSREFTFVPGLGLPGRVWSSLEPEYIPDVVPDENFPRGSIAEREGLHAAFGFPILLGGEVLGVIEFFSREIRQPDQELLNMLATIGSQIGQFIERKRTEEAFRKVQMELAHANRVATMGQLTSSIAHEVNQPIAAAVTYALAARRFLSAEPPNFHEVDDALSLIVKEGNRAGEVVGRIRALIKKAPARKDAIEINDAIIEVIALTRTEAANSRVSVRTQLAEGLPRVQGDRVQLQQVLLNLIINAIEAMRDAGEEERELLISSRNEPDGVSVEVRDSGPGFAPADLDRVFEAFYTTKPGGLGLGLSICW